MAPPYFPVDLDNIHANIKFHATGEEGFDIGSIHIKTIPLNHTNVGVGYRLEEDGKSFVFLTDNELKHRHENGLKFIDYVKFSNGADVLFHDSEYTTEDYKEGWGHSVCYDSLELALKAGVKKLGLFHHNQDRTDDEIDHIEKKLPHNNSRKGLEDEMPRRCRRNRDTALSLIIHRAASKHHHLSFFFHPAREVQGFPYGKTLYVIVLRKPRALVQVRQLLTSTPFAMSFLSISSTL